MKEMELEQSLYHLSTANAKNVMKTVKINALVEWTVTKCQ